VISLSPPGYAADVTISMPVEPAANDLLTRDPLALLIGMLLDQQVPLERAFSAPLDLVRRLGHEPTAAELADFDPDALAAIFSERPALHRYPKSMAARVQDLARLLVSDYEGDAARVWTTATSGAELLQRVGALPGFGTQKAKIFVAMLGKQFGTQPPGRTSRWRTSWTRTRSPRCAPTSRASRRPRPPARERAFIEHVSTGPS
jgi:uncharacterized HhH-GPD family protein